MWTVTGKIVTRYVATVSAMFAGIHAARASRFYHRKLEINDSKLYRRLVARNASGPFP